MPCALQSTIEQPMPEHASGGIASAPSPSWCLHAPRIANAEHTKEVNRDDRPVRIASNVTSKAQTSPTTSGSVRVHLTLAAAAISDEDRVSDAATLAASAQE